MACDHLSDPWCHELPSGQQIIVQVCIECLPGESAEDCENRYRRAVSQAMQQFPANC
jgi:hypothetical protein